MITLEADEKEYHLPIPRAMVNTRRLETFAQWLRDESAAQMPSTRDAHPALFPKSRLAAR